MPAEDPPIEKKAPRPFDPEIAYLTPTDAALRLGVTQSAIRNAVAEGRLPATHAFGRVLLDPADVEAYRSRTQPQGRAGRGRPPKGPQA